MYVAEQTMSPRVSTQSHLGEGVVVVAERMDKFTTHRLVCLDRRVELSHVGEYTRKTSHNPHTRMLPSVETAVVSMG